MSSFPSRPRVRCEDRIQRRLADGPVGSHCFFHSCKNVSKPDLASDEPLDGHFVGRVENRRQRSAHAPGQMRQPERWEFILIRIFECQCPDFRQVRGRH